MTTASERARAYLRVRGGRPISEVVTVEGVVLLLVAAVVVAVLSAAVLDVDDRGGLWELVPGALTGMLAPVALVVGQRIHRRRRPGSDAAAPR